MRTCSIRQSRMLRDKTRSVLEQKVKVVITTKHEMFSSKKYIKKPRFNLRVRYGSKRSND